MNEPLFLVSEFTPTRWELMGYWILELSIFGAPLFAGLSFFVKRKMGELHPTIFTGLFLASIWAGWLLLSLVFPDFRRQIIPKPLVNYIWVFLYFFVLIDWIVTFKITRLRYWILDALTFIIFVLPLLTFVLLLKFHPAH